MVKACRQATREKRGKGKARTRSFKNHTFYLLDPSAMKGGKERERKKELNVSVVIQRKKDMA